MEQLRGHVVGTAPAPQGNLISGTIFASFEGTGHEVLRSCRLMLPAGLSNGIKCTRGKLTWPK